VDQEPPQPQWLVQSNLMTALAASMSQAQTSTDGATDGSNSLPQELMDRIHELVPNISDESNNLPQEMIDRLVAMVKYFT
jgi:E3 ubiquitin-protein ligase AIP2